MAAQVSGTATILKLMGGNVGVSFELGAVIAMVIFIIYTVASRLFDGVYTEILPNLVEQYGTVDTVIPALAIEFLPAGVTGLALAGILSVMLSTADSYLLVAVQTCVHDIGKIIPPKMSDKHELLLSRIFTVALAVGALLVALFSRGIYTIITDTFSYYAAGMELPAVAALYISTVLCITDAGGT